MSKLGKKLITILSVLLCAMLTLAAVLIYMPKSKTAVAATDPTVAEIYNDTDKRFDYTNLQALYRVLTGSGTTYQSVVDMLDHSSVDSNGYHYITSDDIRGYQINNGNNISVKFGGLKWDVVFMTTVRDSYTDGGSPANAGDVVVDLWLSADQVVDNKNPSIKFSPHGGNLEIKDNVPYPDNMYSTSQIRVEALNADGQYSSSTTALAAKAGQKSTNRYARFTMTGIDDSLTKFIVQPKDIAYQENLSKQIILGSYQCPNDAYSKTMTGWRTGSENIGNRNVYLIQNKLDYDAWKEDYVWLPAISETGHNTDISGLWSANADLRSSEDAWLRSGIDSAAGHAFYLTSTGAHDYIATNNKALAVRPALHFNLTKADEDARKIFFGTDKTTVDEDDGIALLEHTYDDTFAEIDIPDWDRLEIGTAPSNSYLEGNNKFKAKLTTLKDGDYETGEYEITVTPKGDYHWEDGSTDPRKYVIHIEPATLTVTNMANPYEGVAVSGSLLQSGYTVSSNKLGTNITPKIKYYKVEPNDYSSATRPPDEQFIEDDGTFTASSEGTYKIYYNVEVAHHTIYRGAYDVIVSGTDSANLVANGTIGSGSAAYGESDAELLEDKDELKAALKDKIKIQKDGVDYDSTRFDNIWNKLEAVVCTKDGTTYTEAEKNGGGHYNVGTYYIDLRYEENADKSVTLSWLGELPSFEITKPATAIVAKVVAKDDGSLTSAYGDPLADMEIVISNPSYLAYDETVEDLPFGKFIMQDGDGNTVNNPPVGDYIVIADISEIVNYTIKFDTSEYEITPRPVTLKVADETVKYGTDLSTYKFKSLTFANETTPAYDDILSEIATKANTVYSLYLDGSNVGLSNDVPVGEYELRVTVTSDNYEFEYIYGTLTITKADFDMSGIELKNGGFVYDGKPHEAEIVGTLPDGVTVTYEYHLNGEKIDGVPTEIGLYTVYAKFTHDNENYNDITDKVAYLKIAASQEELDKGFPEEEPDPDGNNGSETPDPNPNPSGDLENKKNAAKDALDKAAQAKKDAIDASDMTDEEKAAAKAKVDAELAAGKDAIDNATDENGVNSAENTAKTNIGNISIDPIKNDGSFPWWILAVAAGVLILVIVVIIVIKKRQVADGDEDYYDEDYDFDEEDYEEDFDDEDF